VCGAAGLVSGVLGKGCKVVQHAGRVVKAAKKLAGGHPVGAAKAFLGSDGKSSASSAGGPRAATLIGLAAIGAWVLGGAKFALHETAKVLSQTTTPRLRSTWFSTAYWQMAGVAAVLTLPFLLAATVQAVMRSDGALLARAAMGYLPLAMLAVGVAAPVTMLLLAASDQLSAVVASAAGNAGTSFLTHAATVVAALSVFARSPFLAFLVGLFTAAATITLWLELLVREAAVYVIVLLMPLAFAALVWPARRVWAIRAVELLIALILSKFAIVAVLALGGAALDRGFSALSIAGALAGGALVLMAAFSPWALLRLLPMAELASSAAGSLRGEVAGSRTAYKVADTFGGRAENLLWNLRQHGHERDAAEPEGVQAVPGHGAGTPDRDPHGTPMHDLTSDGAPERHSEIHHEGSVAGVSAAAGSAAGAAADGETGLGREASRAAEERLPGMESRWQEEDFEWEPLEFSVEGVAPASSRDERQGGEQSAESATSTDDHDPRPPEQPPVEGRL
jgi:hypothetical protein